MSGQPGGNGGGGHFFRRCAVSEPFTRSTKSESRRRQELDAGPKYNPTKSLAQVLFCQAHTSTNGAGSFSTRRGGPKATPRTLSRIVISYSYRSASATGTF